jgi:hypothetical protein
MYGYEKPMMSYLDAIKRKDTLISNKNIVDKDKILRIYHLNIHQISSGDFIKKVNSDTTWD